MARKTLPVDIGGIETPHFEGFAPDAFAFFEDLAAAQTRDWFQAHRHRYDQGVRAPFMALVSDLSSALAERGVPLRGEPGRALFRIHRDVRFAKDKSPYKTNAGAVLTRDASKTGDGLLYVHLAPEGCFCALGYYQPSPPVLAGIRQIIAGRPQTWRSIVAALDEAGLPLDRFDALTRAPRGFDVSEPDLIDALKLKSIIVRAALSREEMGAPGLVQRIADFAERASPILRLG